MMDYLINFAGKTVQSYGKGKFDPILDKKYISYGKKL